MAEPAGAPAIPGPETARTTRRTAVRTTIAESALRITEAGLGRAPRRVRVRIRTTGTVPPRQHPGPGHPTADASSNLSAEHPGPILPTAGAANNRLAGRPAPILPTAEAQDRSWAEPPPARRKAGDGRVNYWEEAPRLIRPTAAEGPRVKAHLLSILARRVRENPANQEGSGAQPHGDRRSAARQSSDHLEPGLLPPVAICTSHSDKSKFDGGEIQFGAIHCGGEDHGYLYFFRGNMGSNSSPRISSCSRVSSAEHMGRKTNLEPPASM